MSKFLCFAFFIVYFLLFSCKENTIKNIPNSYMDTLGLRLNIDSTEIYLRKKSHSFTKYYGKTVGEFLDSLSIPYQQHSLSGHYNINLLDGVWLGFKDGNRRNLVMYINIITPPKHQEWSNENQEWSFELLKKEKIQSIELFVGGETLK